MLQARQFDDLYGSSVLLLWGDSSDMGALLDQVRSLGQERPTAAVGHGENTVTIRFSTKPGMSHVSSGAGVSWECAEDTLCRLADLIVPLLHSSGHQFVDTDGIVEEVVISSNEYPTDFCWSPTMAPKRP
jgi:hypothetical protein